MRAPVTARPARIGAFWFGVQAIWSALLGVFLQSRISELVPADDVRAYALVAAGGAVLAAIVQVAAGFASDRRIRRVGHRREFYIAGVALAVPAIALFFVAPTAAWLALAFAGIQIGVNLASGPYQAAIPDAIDASASGRASAWMSVYSFSGSVTGLVIAAALHGASAAGALLAVFVVSAAVTVVHLRTLPFVATRPVPLHITGDVLTVLLSRGAINVGFYTLFGFLFFFVRETLAVSDARTTTGLLFIAFTLAGVGGAAIAGKPADRYDKRVVISIAAAAIAAAVSAFALAPNVPVAFAASIAAGFAWGAFFTADWAIAFAVLPRGAMASAMGVWNLAAALPQIVAPLITAPLVTALDAHRHGLGPRVALLLVVVEFTAGTLLLWRLPRAALAPVAGDP